MRTASDVLNRCQSLGIAIRVKGEHLALSPAGRATPDLVAEIKAAKPLLMAILDPKLIYLQPDQRPWVHTARQILSGEFDGPFAVWGGSMIESLLIGVRGIHHPDCQAARVKLETALQRVRGA